MNELVLIGGGSHAGSCIDVLLLEGKWKIRGIIERKQHSLDTALGYPVLGEDSDLENLVEVKAPVLIAVGQLPSSFIRRSIYERASKLGVVFPTVQSPLSYVSSSTSLGSGTIVMHGAIVNNNAHVGRQCIINTKALIEHDCSVGDFTHVSTGALINGGVSIGQGCFLGSGSTIREGIEIGDDVVVGAGVTVMRDLPSGTIIKGKS